MRAGGGHPTGQQLTNCPYHQLLLVSVSSHGPAGECGLVGDLLDYAQYHISFEELFFQVTSVHVSLRRNGSPRHAAQRPLVDIRDVGGALDMPATRLRLQQEL